MSNAITVHYHGIQYVPKSPRKTTYSDFFLLGSKVRLGLTASLDCRKDLSRPGKALRIIGLRHNTGLTGN